MSRRQRTADERERGRVLAVRVREWRDTIRSIEASKVTDPGFCIVAQIVVRGLGKSLDDLADEVLSQ